MRLSILALVSAAVIGLVVGLMLKPSGSANVAGVEPPAAEGFDHSSPISILPTTDVTNPQIQALANQLAVEIEARRALQQSVHKLSERLDRLTGNRSSVEAADSGSPNIRAVSPAAGAGWFDEQSLIDAGIAVSEAGRMKAVYEELELEKLYISDKAVREDWSGAKRVEAIQALQAKLAALREEVGDDHYGAYLYASGQPNRVKVQGVLDGSPAASAGIRSGDYVLSYDDRRVYNGRELRSATAQGTADEVIVVTIDREGSIQQVYVPRGPLGIRMTSDRIAP